MLDNEEILIIPIDSIKKEKLLYFDCDNKGINKFLKDTALREHLDRLSSTYLATEEKTNKIIGFYSINIYTLSYKNTELKKEYPYSIHLGYFAINKEYQKKGYGSHLLFLVIEEMIEIARKIGIRYLSVQPLDDKKDWYIKRGFEELKTNDFNILAMDLIKTGKEGVLSESN